MDLITDSNALWKKRMRSPMVSWFDIAKHDNSKAIIESNISGTKRTNYWDIENGTFEEIKEFDDDYYCLITPDGKYLHFLKDNKGDELGHRCRMPFFWWRD
jgi:hypothetical protein